jgi:hypothetical protein
MSDAGPMVHSTKPEAPSNHAVARPFSVTLAAPGVLIISGINLLRFVEALRQWQFLSALLPISPLYLVLSGLAWGGIGLSIVWGLWLGYRWAAPSLRWAASAYTLYYWIDRLTLSSPDVETNWLFAAVFNAIILSLIFWILSRRKAKAFFGELHDQS